jgi:hypothetical protein
MGHLRGLARLDGIGGPNRSGRGLVGGWRDGRPPAGAVLGGGGESGAEGYCR